MNFTEKEMGIILNCLFIKQETCYCTEGERKICKGCKDTKELLDRIKSYLAKQNEEPQMMCIHGQNYGTCSFGCKFDTQKKEKK